MDSLSRLQLPSAVTPDITLVMVVYGGFDQSLATLESLAATADVPAEVIVVDNASPDGAGRRLRDSVSGATFLLQARNLGYGTAVNLGVLHGRGRYVGILNSDLAFEPGWLAALVNALDADPAAGAAAPLYLYPSGEVFDAGGLLGADGRGYAYGEVLSAGDPPIGFRRYVDYGSAAALVVRREAFDRVGGFDPIYGLGYYEDSDLGFSLRRAGFETVYVPSARVRHAQGGSFNRQQRLELMARNRRIFAERFAEELRGRPLLDRPPLNHRRDLVVRDWWAVDRVLVIDRGGRLAPLAGRLAARRPSARVTWITQDGGAVPADDRVEAIGPVEQVGRWLEERRFHYTAVVVQPPAAADIYRAIDRSQPQARVIDVDDVGGDVVERDVFVTPR